MSGVGVSQCSGRLVWSQSRNAPSRGEGRAPPGVPPGEGVVEADAGQTGPVRIGSGSVSGMAPTIRAAACNAKM
jgi:hypothetical protein